MSEGIQIAVATLLMLAFILFVISILLTQQGILNNIQPENRLMEPGKIWLQIIPLYGMIFQFKVVARIADSIRNELTVPSEGEWLLAEQISSGDRPTYRWGLTCAVLSCCTVIRFPIVEDLIALALIVCEIFYWVELRKFRQQIRQRLAVSD